MKRVTSYLLLCFCFLLLINFSSSSDPETIPLLDSGTSLTQSYGSIEIDVESALVTDTMAESVIDPSEYVDTEDQEHQNQMDAETEHNATFDQDNDEIETIRPSVFEFGCIRVENKLPTNHGPFPMNMYLWSIGIVQYLFFIGFISSISDLSSSLNAFLAIFCAFLMQYFTLSSLNLRITPSSIFNYSVSPASPIPENLARKISETYRLLFWLAVATKIGLMITDGHWAFLLDLMNNLLIVLYLSPCFPTYIDRLVPENPEIPYFYIGDVLVEINLNPSPLIDRQMNHLYWASAIFSYIFFNWAIQTFSTASTLLEFEFGIIFAFQVFLHFLILAGFKADFIPPVYIHFVIRPFQDIDDLAYRSKLPNILWYIFYFIYASRLALLLPDSCFTLVSKENLSFVMYLLEVIFVLFGFPIDIESVVFETFPIVNTVSYEQLNNDENDESRVENVDVEGQNLNNFLS